MSGSSLFQDSENLNSGRDYMERIFDDKIQSEEIELTCNKMKSKEEIFDNCFWYDDFN